MVSSLATVEDGHVDTLTAEQAIKLKELWVMLLDVIEDSNPARDVISRSSAVTLDPPPVAAPRTNTFASHSSIQGVRKDHFGDGDRKTRVAGPDGTASGKKVDHRLLESYPPSVLHEKIWLTIAADNPDALLLRFLRAQKFDLHRAFNMTVTVLKWRIDEAVNEIVEMGEAGLREKIKIESGEREAEAFMFNLRSGKSYIRGVDRAGRPICYVDVGMHHASDLKFEHLRQFTIYLIETARLLLEPPHETATVFFDMSQFTMANMDFNYIKFFIACFQIYYPESLGMCLVHRAPLIFQGVWNLISPLIDPVTRKKIHFTRTDANLLEFIPPEHLPLKFGGTDPRLWTFVDPVPGENKAFEDKAGREVAWLRRKDLEQRFERLTREWVAGSEEAAMERATLVPELAKARFELEPFIRAKTVYHRLGIVKVEGGECIVSWD